MLLRFSDNGKSNIAKKAEMVMKAIEGFLPEEERIMRILIFTVEKIQSQISQVIAENNYDITCRECEGACCSAEIQEFLLHKVDLLIILFNLTSAEKEKIMNAIEGQPAKASYCCFLNTQEGCTLDKIRRPVICKAHFCSSKLSSSIDQQREELVSLAAAMKTVLFKSLCRQGIFDKELTPAKYPL